MHLVYCIHKLHRCLLGHLLEAQRNFLAEGVFLDFLGHPDPASSECGAQSGAWNVFESDRVPLRTCSCSSTPPCSRSSWSACGQFALASLASESAGGASVVLAVRGRSLGGPRFASCQQFLPKKVVWAFSFCTPGFESMWRCCAIYCQSSGG